MEVRVTDLEIGLGAGKIGLSAGLVEVNLGGIPLLLNDGALVDVLRGLSLGLTALEVKLGLLVGKLRAELPNLGLNEFVADDRA